MIYCLNPDCQKPQNPDSNKFCFNCGTRLLLSDRYRAIELIGQGGFGRTFLAVDEFKPSKPRCVIKQFFPQAQGTNNEEKAADLFRQEAVRLDELGKHPQIPELLAYLTQNHRQYLVQQFISGQNLAQELETQGVFNEAQIQQVLKELLPVLAFIHTNKVIHRDIKPENIIRRESDKKLILVDFGAAKFATHTALTKPGTIIGSAGYVAPEQAVGKATFSSDIYGLGVTCIHLLTLIEPFHLFDVSEGKWVWRDYLSTPVSQRLGIILDKMLENTVKRRYQAAEEVINDLDSLSTPVSFKTPLSSNTPLPFTSTSSQTWECVNTLAAHESPVLSVAIDTQGNTLVSASEDKTIKIWNLHTGELIKTLYGHSERIRSICISADGRTLISGSDDKKIKIWNLPNRELIKTLSGHKDGVLSVTINPQDNTVISGSKDKTIRIWHLGTGKLIHSIKEHLWSIYAIAISQDGQILASGDDDKKINIWNLNNWELNRTLSQGNSGIIEAFMTGFDGAGGTAIISLAISPHREFLVSGNYDKTIKIWNLANGELVKTISGHTRGITSVAFNAQNQSIASASLDQTIKIWDLSTGKLINTLSGHSRGVATIAFSADGKTLVSGSFDNTIKIWRISNAS